MIQRYNEQDWCTRLCTLYCYDSCWSCSNTRIWSSHFIISILRAGIIQTHGLLSDPRYRSSTSLFDLKSRGASPLSSDFGYGTSATPSSVSRYGSLATLSSDMTHESSPPSSSDSQYGSSTTLPSDWQYRGSTTLPSDLQFRSLFSADSRYKGQTTATTSTHSTSSLVKHYQKKPLHPHDEGKLHASWT